jgi:sugar lactone lactonase YvrE
MKLSLAGSLCLLTICGAATASPPEAYAFLDFAGGSSGADYKDARGTAARFWNPTGIVQRPDGTFVVVDTRNCAIREISPDGHVTAGGPPIVNSRDGRGIEARLAYPTGAAMDHLGNVYFVESFPGSVRRVRPDGTVETVAPAYEPRSIASDPAGRIYVTGRGPTFRIDTDGTSGYLTSTSDVDGIAVAADGTIYFSSTQNMIIVAIPPSGPNRILSPPGPESGGNMIVLKNGDLLVCDVLTQTLLRFTPDGVASYVPLQYPDPSDPYLGHLRNPTALLEAANGDILIADSDNNAIRRFSSDFVLKTLAGVENPVGATDGPIAQAKFRSPQHAIRGRPA